MPSEIQHRPRYTAVWLVLLLIFLMGLLGDCLRVGERTRRDDDPEEISQPLPSDAEPAVRS